MGLRHVFPVQTKRTHCAGDDCDMGNEGGKRRQGFHTTRETLLFVGGIGEIGGLVGFQVQ